MSRISGKIRQEFATSGDTKRHSSYAYTGKLSDQYLSSHVGMNSVFKHKIHAEKEAIMKLISNKTFNKRKTINVVVIRVNRLGHLRNSKPCQKCQEFIHKMTLKGYRFNVFYSVD